MKVTDIVNTTIDRLPKWYVFAYADFISEVNQKEAIIKALNRLVASGKIAKLARGKYYKPRVTIFGTLRPDQNQVVKDLLKENGKPTGYLTCLSIYNKLGLTTQFSFTIQIGRNQIRPAFKREQYTISFIRQKNTITRENIPLLQILDSIRYIKRIPDSDTEFLCRRLLAIVKALSRDDKESLVRLAKKYPPATRTILGAILDQLRLSAITEPLFSSLNPITRYKLPGASKALKYTEKWNIV